MTARIAVDTSVLVPALVGDHPEHGRCLRALWRGDADADELVVDVRVIVECYSVLTGLPVRPRISPTTARRLIADNVESLARLVDLAPADVESALDEAPRLGISGGAIHDLMIAISARRAGCERILTLNASDFRRCLPEGDVEVVEP